MPPTVRLRDESEYPEATRRMFELSKQWFNHDFKVAPAAAAKGRPRARRAKR
jgi:hypothetical protein